MKKIISIVGIVAMLAISLFGFSGCGLNLNKVKEEVKKEVENAVNEAKQEIKDVKDDPNFINNNDAYYFIYNGKKFKAGDDITAVEDVGLVIRESEKTSSVPARTYMIGAGYIQTAEKKSAFQVTPYNEKSESVKIPETKIGGFNVDMDNIKNDSKLADLEVYGGIKLGSTEEELKKVFGEPSSTYEGSLWNTYTYKSDKVYRSFEFRINKEGKVCYMRWQNLVYND